MPPPPPPSGWDGGTGAGGGWYYILDIAVFSTIETIFVQWHLIEPEIPRKNTITLNSICGRNTAKIIDVL